MLADGRFVVEGGEYNNCQAVSTITTPWRLLIRYCFSSSYRQRILRKTGNPSGMDFPFMPIFLHVSSSNQTLQRRAIANN